MVFVFVPGVFVPLDMALAYSPWYLLFYVFTLPYVRETYRSLLVLNLNEGYEKNY
jgi:hypothetical protein